ncbi:MAG TPA: aerial mycelium formation protein [Mycobacteriales bacterium]|nr:aerial mycelium formation protein [Mycobacteriales bacterium]
MNDQGALPDGHRRIDRVLADGFLSSIGTCPLAELRELREDAEQEEADLSYLRRILQGRVDILSAELDRRRRIAAGETVVESLVTDLPRILADGSRPAARGMGRHSVAEPSRVSEHRRQVEQLASDLDISDVGARSEDEITASLAELRAAEHDVSEARGKLHEVLDACAAEITRRYRDGEADVSALLAEQPPG